MSDTQLDGTANMWFPVEDLYKGREEEYARPFNELPREEAIELVQKRAQEDGEWIIEQGMPEETVVVMRKMMEWVSKSDNIVQCYESYLEYAPSVEWICRHLAQASQRIAGGQFRG